MKRFLLPLLLICLAAVSCKKDETPSVSVNPSTAALTTDGGTVNVDVTANCTWSASSATSGVSVSPASASGDSPVSVTVPANETGSSRTITVTFTCKEGGNKEELTITQEYSEEDIKLEVNSCKKDDENYDYMGGTDTLTIESNYPWTATITSPATISATSGVKGTSTVIVTIPQNEGKEVVEYDFSVYVTTPGRHTHGTGFSYAQDPAYVTYGGVAYKFIKLKDGNYWMAEPLRYIPDGSSVSEDPATGTICYPQGFSDVKAWRDTTFNGDGSIKTITWKHSETFAPLKDEESIKSHGLLYSWDVIFGEAVTKDNYNTFEGRRGICPEGWHVPAKAEWKGLFGTVSGDETAKDAFYYDTDYDGAVVASMESEGFMFGFTGLVSNKKYITANVITSAMSDVPDYITKAAMTYIASSTGVQPKAGKDATQMYAPMSTFSAGTFDKTTKTSPDLGKYPKGRLTVGYANFAGGFVQVRCVKDAKKSE